MKFRRHMELEHGLKQMDIAPLIDIIFQLLIFFMLTSSFIMHPGIRINLPKAVTSETVKYENVEIMLSGENVLYLENKIVTLNEVKSFLKQIASANKTVLIKADKHAALGRVVELWDLCRELGLSKVNIATSQE